jgi:isopentenyl-diphosphate delta-isomerase
MNNNLVDYKRVNLVNDQDEIIASADKLEAHLGEAMLHQAISFFLFRRNKAGRFQLLLQKRSDKKIVGASQWANTLCANVAMGENHRQCLQRRLKEELGISLPKGLRQKVREVFVLNYQVPCNQRYSEREIDHIFALFLNYQEFKKLLIKINPEEVDEVAWFDWLNLINKKGLVNKKKAPWFQLFLDDARVKGAINLFLENNIISMEK